MYVIIKSIIAQCAGIKDTFSKRGQNLSIYTQINF